MKPPPQAIHWDPWLIATGPALRAVVQEAVSSLPQARRDAQARREAVVGSIFANLILAKAIAVPLANLRLTRYDRRDVTSSQLKPTLDALEVAGWIVRHPAVFKELRTIIEVTPRLKTTFDRCMAGTADIGREPSEEVIFLKKRRAAESEVDLTQSFDTSLPRPGELISYTDTAVSRQMREEVRAFNRFMATADIRLLGIPASLPFKPFRRIFATEGPVKFNLHGRLYGGAKGGWHQGLPKEERHRIRINGEPVADLDYKSLHPHLAYHEVNTTPPKGDLYRIPGLEGHRDGVKAAMSAMLSRNGEFRRLPSKIRKMLPPEWNGTKVAAAIKSHHPAIAHLFGKDRGVKYMFTDSQILMAVLIRLMNENIPALPMHDGIMVQLSAIRRATVIMQEASLRIAGVDVPVSNKLN